MSGPTQQSTTPAVPPARVGEARRFNRWYTKLIGALDEGHLNSPFSLAEVRVIYEIAHWKERSEVAPTAAEVGRELGMDAGYVSRILRGFADRNLIERDVSPSDTRQSRLSLTAAGRATFLDLDRRANESIALLFQPLGEEKQQQIVQAMRTIDAILNDDSPKSGPAVVIRQHRVGDMGWVVWRHGELYAAEYGWNEHFESLVAEVVVHFVENFDPRVERCWIAEYQGERAGSVFLVRHPDRPGVAKLRLLLVEPSARGLGIGRQLVDECTRFARQSGYHTITLWTNSVLVSARKIYEAAGYKLVAEDQHTKFGPELVGQTWELELFGTYSGL